MEPNPIIEAWDKRDRRVRAILFSAAFTFSGLAIIAAACGSVSPPAPADARSAAYDIGEAACHYAEQSIVDRPGTSEIEDSTDMVNLRAACQILLCRIESATAPCQ